MPAWWRYADPFFRKLHASDLARVLPTHPWDDDPDLRAPPPGRSYTEPFEDGLPVPKLPEPSAATAVIATGPIAATTTAATAAGTNVAATTNTSASTSAIDASGTAAVGGAPSLLGATMPPPPPAAPAAFEPPPAPIVVPPSGVSVGEDLLDAATPDEVASLARQMLAFDDDRPAALAAAAKSAGKSERAYEDWLVGRGLGRRGGGRTTRLPREPEGGFAPSPPPRRSTRATRVARVTNPWNPRRRKPLPPQPARDDPRSAIYSPRARRRARD